jgi:hypothetical protein
MFSKLVSLNIDSKETRKAHVEAIENTLSEKSNKYLWVSKKRNRIGIIK